MTTRLDSTGASAGAVNLQDAVEHHGQAVEQDLRREHHQHPRAERDHAGPRTARRPAEQQRHQRSREDRDHHADRDKQQHGPADQRGGGLPHLLAARGLGPVAGGPVAWGPVAWGPVAWGRAGGGPRGARQHRHHDGGEGAAHHDVVDDVRHHVGRGVRGAQARGLDGVREHHLAAEPDDPPEHRDRADQHRRPAYPPAPLPSTPPLGHGCGHSVDSGGRPPGAPRDWGDAIPPDPPGPPGRWAGTATAGPCSTGRRPSMSSQCSAGVRSITLVKLTFSLAAVSPAIPASSAIRTGRDRPAAEAPSIAPSAFAPASPSIARSPRSSGSSARAAVRGAATLSWPAAPSRAPEAAATLMARPGRRSNRLSRFAPPATRPALMTTSAGEPPASAALMTPVTPIPPSFTAPVVTSPCRSAPRCPPNPRRSPEPARSS